MRFQSMKFKPTVRLATVILVAMAFALTSCGKSASRGVTFTINNGGEPQSLDPALLTGVPENRLYTAFFEGLMVADPRTAEPVSGVAESWSVSDDGLVYTFKLRDAAWSDGTPVTAGDFEYGIKRVLDPQTASIYAFMPGDVIKGANAYNKGVGKAEDVGIRAPDDKTLEFTLASPCAYFLELLTHYSFGPAPRAAIDKFGANWIKAGNMVSNGPFMLSEWSPQKRIIAVKNPNYRDAANVKLDTIIFLPIDDSKTAYNMYKNGEIDWNTAPPTELLEELMTRDDFHAVPQLGSVYFSFNTTRKPFDNPMVRRALSMAIDRKTLTEQVIKTRPVASDALVPPMDGYTPAKGNAFNPVAARALLAQAGFLDGKGFPKFSILYNTDGGNRLISEFLQNQWKINLGLDITLRNQEWKTFLATRNDLDFDVARNGWVGDYRDPMTFLDMFAEKGGIMSNSGYYSEDYASLIRKAAALPAGAERYQVLHDAEELLVTRDQVVIPLLVVTKTNLIDTEKWGGWYGNVMDYHWWKFIYKK